MTDARCPQADAHLEELALGVLGGRERAEALAHLEHCPACAEREQQLSEVTDALVDLVPGSEPPVGFENRVLARVAAARQDVPARSDITARPDSTARADVAALGGTASGGTAFGDVSFGGTALHGTALGGTALSRRGRRSPRRSSGVRRPNRWQAAVLVAAACAAAFSGGWSLRGSGHAQAPAVTAAQPALVAALRNAGGTVGQVYVNTGPHPWFYIGLHGVSAGTSSVHCFLTYRGGQVEDLGSYPVVAGTAGWGARILGNPRDVTGARITTPAGATVATAVL